MINKKTISIVLSLAVIFIGGWWAIYRNNPDANSSKTSAGIVGESLAVADSQKTPFTGSGSYVLNNEKSIADWEAKKPLISGYVDKGEISIKNGELIMSDGLATSGNFTIDMNSISVESTGRGSGESSLAKHLKSKDFFDAGKYPTAGFKIEKSEKGSADGSVIIFGELTIKGITKPISFPAEIYTKDGILRAGAIIELDRTVWDIRYASGKFFKSIGDNLINDKFSVGLDLSADPAGK